MKFAEFLAKSPKTQKQIADDLNVSQAHISQIASGKKLPSAELIRRIEVISDERVTLRDWFPEVPDEAITPETPEEPCVAVQEVRCG